MPRLAISLTNGIRIQHPRGNPPDPSWLGHPVLNYGLRQQRLQPGVLCFQASQTLDVRDVYAVELVTPEIKTRL